MTHSAPLPAQHTPAEPVTLIVPAATRPERIDRFLGDALRSEGISREKIKQAITSGAATVNGTLCISPKQVVRPGDTIMLAIVPPPSSVTPEAGELTILFRDTHIAVINKPPHLTVHPAPSCPLGTLTHRLAAHFPELLQQEGLRPGIVHRLDKDTSGILVVALTEKDRLTLSASFAERTIYKEYLALAVGVPTPASGEITHSLGRHPSARVKMAVVPVEKGGREAHSTYRTLYADPNKRFSLLAVRIYTGRTHQIRVHLASIGHPIIGDALYGGHTPTAPGTPLPKAERQMLHAWKIAFPHPETNQEITFSCPPPQDFVDTALAASRTMQHVVVTGLPGCGKSALLQALHDNAVPTWSADAIVRRLYEPGGEAWQVLLARYGERFVPDATLPVDKKKLFAAMCESRSFRRDVETIVHPFVRQDMAAFWQAHAHTGKTAVSVVEIPLFLESGWRGDTTRAGKGKPTHGKSEILVGIHTPQELRHKRLRDKRGWEDAVIHTIDSWHWAEDAKMKACDLIVDNSGSLEELQNQTRALLHTLAELREKRENDITAAVKSCWQ